MQISPEVLKDRFKVPPSVPDDHVVVQDRSQSGWRLMAPTRNPGAQPVAKLPLHSGRSPMYGHHLH